jgi:hypothetical protein
MQNLNDAAPGDEIGGKGFETPGARRRIGYKRVDGQLNAPKICA